MEKQQSRAFSASGSASPPPPANNAEVDGSTAKFVQGPSSTPSSPLKETLSSSTSDQKLLDNLAAGGRDEVYRLTVKMLRQASGRQQSLQDTPASPNRGAWKRKSVRSQMNVLTNLSDCKPFEKSKKKEERSAFLNTEFVASRSVRSVDGGHIEKHERGNGGDANYAIDIAGNRHPKSHFNSVFDLRHPLNQSHQQAMPMASRFQSLVEIDPGPPNYGIDKDSALSKDYKQNAFSYGPGPRIPDRYKPGYDPSDSSGRSSPSGANLLAQTRTSYLTGVPNPSGREFGIAQSNANYDTQFTGTFQALVEKEKFRQGVPPQKFNKGASGGAFGKAIRPVRKSTLGPGPKYNLQNLQDMNVHTDKVMSVPDIDQLWRINKAKEERKKKLEEERAKSLLERIKKRQLKEDEKIARLQRNHERRQRGEPEIEEPEESEEVQENAAQEAKNSSAAANDNRQPVKSEEGKTEEDGQPSYMKWVRKSRRESLMHPKRNKTTMQVQTVNLASGLAALGGSRHNTSRSNGPDASYEFLETNRKDSEWETHYITPTLIVRIKKSGHAENDLARFVYHEGDVPVKLVRAQGPAASFAGGTPGNRDHWLKAGRSLDTEFIGPASAGLFNDNKNESFTEFVTSNMQNKPKAVWSRSKVGRWGYNPKVDVTPGPKYDVSKARKKVASVNPRKVHLGDKARPSSLAQAFNVNVEQESTFQPTEFDFLNDQLTQHTLSSQKKAKFAKRGKALNNSGLRLERAPRTLLPENIAGTRSKAAAVRVLGKKKKIKSLASQMNDVLAKFEFDPEDEDYQEDNFEKAKDSGSSSYKDVYSAPAQAK